MTAPSFHVGTPSGVRRLTELHVGTQDGQVRLTELWVGTASGAVRVFVDLVSIPMDKEWSDVAALSKVSVWLDTATFNRAKAIAFAEHWEVAKATRSFVDKEFFDTVAVSKASNWSQLQDFSRVKLVNLGEVFEHVAVDRLFEDAPIFDTGVLSKSSAYTDNSIITRAKAAALLQLWEVAKAVRTATDKTFSDTATAAKSRVWSDSEIHTRAKALGLSESFVNTVVTRVGEDKVFSDALALVKVTAWSDSEIHTRAKALVLSEAFIRDVVSRVAADKAFADTLTTAKTRAVSEVLGVRAKAITLAEDIVRSIVTRITDDAAFSETASVVKATSWSDNQIFSRTKTLTLAEVYEKALHSYNGPAAAPFDLYGVDNSFCTFGVSTPWHVVSLYWTVGDATAQTRIYRNGFLVGTVNAGVDSWDTNYGEVVGTHSFQVRHLKNTIESGGPTTNVTVASLSCAPAGAPSGLNAWDSSACSWGVSTPGYQASLSWTSGDGEAHTRIYRGGALVHTASPGVTSWTNTGLSATTYGYEVRHVLNGVESGGSSDSVSIGALSCSPDSPPSNLVALDGSYCSGATPMYEVALTWSNGDAAAQTRVYRGGALVHTASAGTNNWTDTGVSPASYSYEVRHYKNGVESTGSSDSVTVASVSCGPTGAPTQIYLTDYSTCASCTPTYRVRVAVDLYDTSASTNLYRGASLVHTMSPGVSVWEYDTGVTAASYTYTAKHIKNGVESTGVSDSLVVANPCSTPSVPTLSLSGVTKSSITIGTQAGGDVTSVTVYRSGTSTVVGTLSSGNSWSITDSSRTPDTQYCYEGKATSSSGCSSAQGGEVCATTLLEAPTIVSVVSNDIDCPFQMRKDVTVSHLNGASVARNEAWYVHVDGDLRAAPSAGATSVTIPVYPGDSTIQVRYQSESPSTASTAGVGMTQCPE